MSILSNCYHVLVERDNQPGINVTCERIEDKMAGTKVDELLKVIRVEKKCIFRLHNQVFHYLIYLHSHITYMVMEKSIFEFMCISIEFVLPMIEWSAIGTKAFGLCMR